MANSNQILRYKRKTCQYSAEYHTKKTEDEGEGRLLPQLWFSLYDGKIASCK